MLQSIRERIQSWVSYVIIGILILAFGLWGVDSYVGRDHVSRVAAKVNGKEITQEDVENTYQRLKRQEEVQTGTFNPAAESELKQKALTQIVNTDVLSKAAQRQGYRVIPSQMNYVLSGIPAFQVEGKFSLERFQQVLSALLYSESAFLNQLHADLLINQVALGLTSTAFVLPDESKLAYQLLNQSRDISYFLIPKSKYLADIHINETDAEKYYQGHQQDFLMPEQVRVEYVELKLPEVKNNLQFTDSELKDYYQNNQNNFVIPQEWQIAQILVRLPDNANSETQKAVRAKLTEIQQQLKAGKSFSEIAKTQSDDQATKAQGGMLPWVNQTMLETDQAKVIANLKVGEVSKPFKTQYGYLFIKLMNEKKAKQQPFSEVKNKIINTLTSQKALEVFAEKTEKLADLSYANPDSLAEVANQLGLEVKTSELFSKEGGDSTLTKNPKIISAAFSPDVLENRNNSNVLALNDETQVVLRVKSYSPAVVAPFAQVKKDILKTLTDQQATEKAASVAQSIMNARQAGKSLSQITSEYKIPMIHLNNVSRKAKQLDSTLLEQVFKKSTIQSVKLSNQDYAVIWVDKINHNVPENSALNTFQQTLAQDFGDLDYALYVESQMKKTKIKTF